MTPPRLRAVLYQIRRDVETHPGGDRVQLQRTMENVADLTGAEVRASLDPDVDLRHVDLVHLFNLTRATDTVRFAANARRQRVPYVVSPIWHAFADMRAFHLASGGLPGRAVRMLGMQGYLAAKELYYEVRQARPPSLRTAGRWRHAVWRVLNGAAAVLPNSHAEAHALLRDVGTFSAPTLIVPNGAETPRGDGPGKPREKLIVCAGRIEPRKNQLSVAKAFLSSPQLAEYRLLFVGAANRAHGTYLSAFQRALVPGRVDYLGERAREDVLELFRRARIGVLASFFETTGLVGLEALACGANVVMTDRGYTREYYGDTVEYCDPYDARSIAAALERAVQDRDRPTPAFFARFDWTEAGRRTVDAYRHALDMRRVERSD